MLLYLALDRGVALLGLPGSDLSVQVPEPLSVCLSPGCQGPVRLPLSRRQMEQEASSLTGEVCPIYREPSRKPCFLLGKTWAACAPQIL